MEKYQDTCCKYCNKKNILNFSEALKCTDCNEYVHISCLRRQSVPGGLFGDTFFNLTCQECSESGDETFIRQKMTWFQVTVLILYHIQNKTAGTANRGFFHWKIHLVTVIERKWDILFSKHVKRRKNWIGTVSGVLSHFSPCFFTSGAQALGASGWWKLTFPNLTPTTSVLMYNELTSDKHISLKTYDDIFHINNLIRKYLPKLAGENGRRHCNGLDKKIYEFMEEINIDVEDELQLTTCKLFDASTTNTILHHDLKINQVLDYVTPLVEQKKKTVEHRKQPKRLKQSRTNFYSFWKTQERTFQHNVYNVIPLRIIEENTLYNYMQNNRCKTRFESALKRKLNIRHVKQVLSIANFNVDEIDQETAVTIHTRHYTTISSDKNSISGSRNEEKVIAHGRIRINQYFISPYTNRLLKPFIRRDKEPKSLWLQLMSEMLAKVYEKYNRNIDWSISSLDYVYVQPDHIPVINNLCEKYFWPGINLTDALQYPEFSCVTMYKKVIVGFGFMVPDIKFNETYISFIFTRPEWRRTGIATFMIYHLIQTCMGKDVTLHVAIDNPAIFLYQKFGFKVEEVIFNFYDTYLRDDCINY